MRRTNVIKTTAAGIALGALCIGGSTAFADADDTEPTTVVNKNGHEVDEHAADGQARATEARAQRLAKAAERAADDADLAEPEVDEPETPAEDKGDNGNHSGPDAHAGEHPNPKAFENPRTNTPQGPKEDHAPQGPKDGHGPDEHAGDHPNEHALAGSDNGHHGK